MTIWTSTRKQELARRKLSNGHLKIVMIMIVLMTNLIPCQPLSHSTRVLLIREMASELCNRSCNLVQVVAIIAVLCLLMVMVTKRMVIV